MKKIYPPGVSTLPGISISKLVYGEHTTAGDLDDDEPLADGNAATHHITLTPATCKAMLLVKVQWYLANTNAVTHELYLLEDAIAAAMSERAAMAYDSGAAKARNTLYVETGGASDKLPTLVYLDTAGQLPFKIDYSAAAGATTGFIKVWGIMLERE